MLGLHCGLLLHGQAGSVPVKKNDSTERDSLRVEKVIQPLDSVRGKAASDSIADSTARRKEERAKKRLARKNVEVEQLVIVPDTLNPLAPSKAAFYSALVPGLGQIYNKRYWKVPLVYGAIGAGAYAYLWNNQQYNRYRDAFKSRRAGFTTDEFYDINGNGSGPDVSDAALQDAQERFQRDRDLSLLLTILAYALNIIDANVDAHLKQYNVSEQLSWKVHPRLYTDPVFLNPVYGLAIEFEF